MRLRPLLLLALSLAVLLSLSAAAQAQTPEPTPEATPEATPPRDAGGAATPAPGLELYPLTQGCHWYYQVRYSIEPKASGGDQLPPEEVVQKLEVYVAPPQVVDGETASVVEWKLDGDLSQRSYYVFRDGAIRCLKRIQGFGEHMKEFTLEPAQPMVLSELQVGQSWVWEGKVNGVEAKQKFTVVREEELQTPAGTFPTLVLQVDFTGEDDSRGWTRRWLAPGIGVVKDESEVETPDSTFRTEGILTRYETP